MSQPEVHATAGDILFVVGFFRQPDTVTPWEMVGIFVDEQEAVSHCKDWRYFVGPVPLNVAVSEAQIAWPGQYFPKGG